MQDQPGQGREATQQDNDRSEFLDALRKGVLLGAGILVLVLPPMWLAKRPDRQTAPPAVVAQKQPAPPPADVVQTPAAAPEPPANDAAPRLADFGAEKPSADVRHVANWAAHTRNHKKHAFVVIDKKQARLYVFGPDAKLASSTPILLGKAIGDHTVPGIGDKPLSQVKEDEKTTPAGRFVAEPGKNTKGEDIIWVDYDAAVSMHRLRLVSKEERRAQRLASATVKDNRISFGCINVPVAFYEGVLDPTVKKHGAIVYVLPETKTPQELFGSWDVEKAPQAAQLAQAPAAVQRQ
jgi:hypothetical protein